MGKPAALAAVSGNQTAAKSAGIAVGVSFLSFASWNVEYKNDDLVTTNFNSYFPLVDLTFEEGISGITGAGLRFGGDWDLSAPPLLRAAFPGLYPRDDLANVAFVVNVNALPAWDFPFVRLRTSTNGAEIRQKVTFTCAGMNQGDFAAPGNNLG